MSTSAQPGSDQAIAEELRQSFRPSQFLEYSLSTNERVIARVTDGIYRQPGSAIRELIANAYDADATRVSVKTDAPDFTRITVEDNGIGMSPEAVIHLLRNIGGSAKRTAAAAKLGVAEPTDPTRSPGGRKLIGKLGIGMFSVAQLTHSFQIITKTAGDDFRTVVLVNLKQFRDESLGDEDGEFTAGRYRVWREAAGGTEGQGTTVVLTAIRPQTRATLKSEQMWNAVDNPLTAKSGARSKSAIPTYHIGRLDSRGQVIGDPETANANLPWAPTDDPTEAFERMVDNVWGAVAGRTTVKLADVFDNYLQMVWQLSLAMPFPYVDRNPLDEPADNNWAHLYKISNNPKGSAEPITPSGNDTVRERAGLGVSPPTSQFDVFVDGVHLRRPLKFHGLPTTEHALKKPLLFVGGLRETFAGVANDVSTGPLDFEAYLFWTPRVAPTEHQGVLVRIHGASGTLFDSTFMNYQVAELTRLRQITCEIFVREGLEPALNIDRESFNTSHPHTVILTRWLHSALRQLATAQKAIAQKVRLENRGASDQVLKDYLARLIDAANDLRTDGEGLIPRVTLLRGEPEPGQQSLPMEVGHIFTLSSLLAEIPGPAQARPPSGNSLKKLEALIALLSVYGLLDNLSPKEQDNLLGLFLGVLEAENLG